MIDVEEHLVGRQATARLGRMIPRSLPCELGYRRFFRKARISEKHLQVPRNTRLGKNPRTSQEGPFGEVIRRTGDYAAANPFQFSSKYQDDETGLLYYGFRYYQPWTGRWLSKDSAGEGGGPNLYGFVLNNPVNAIDSLGLIAWEWSYDGTHHLTGKIINGVGSKTIGILGWNVISFGYEVSGSADLTLDSSVKQAECHNTYVWPPPLATIPTPSLAYDPSYGVGVTINQNGGAGILRFQQSVGLYTKILSSTLVYHNTLQFSPFKTWGKCGCFVGSAQVDASLHGTENSIPPALIAAAVWAYQNLGNYIQELPPEPVYVP